MSELIKMKKKKKRKRLLLIIPSIVVVLILIVAAVGYITFHDVLKASDTVRKLEDNLWYMEYAGDYGFENFLKHGGASSDEEMARYITRFLTKGFYSNNAQSEKLSFACSTIAAKTKDGDYVCGRNFDWEECKGIVVHTKPEGGYESISTANLDFIGFGEYYVPDEGIQNKLMTLAAVYVPLDGMNEKGLCVADLVVGEEDMGETHQSTNKPNLTTVSAIRMLLDHAADVNEAVELLKQYDMNSSAGMMHHLSISDARGNSVVVEYINNVMHVTDTQQVTNFYLTAGEAYGIGGDSAMSFERYNMLHDIYGDANGIMSTADIKSALKAVSCGTLNRGRTQWSIVYNKSRLSLDFYFKEQYDSPYNFIIK